MSDKLFDAGDEESVRKNKDALALMRADEAVALSELLEQPSFRVFLWDLIMNRCRFQDTSFHENPHEFAMREGRRSIGQELFLRVLTLQPEAVIIMHQEATSRHHQPGKKRAK
jgi:hypothetical protein